MKKITIIGIILALVIITLIVYFKIVSNPIIIDELDFGFIPNRRVPSSKQDVGTTKQDMRAPSNEQDLGMASNNNINEENLKSLSYSKIQDMLGGRDGLLLFNDNKSLFTKNSIVVSYFDILKQLPGIIKVGHTFENVDKSLILKDDLKKFLIVYSLNLLYPKSENYIVVVKNKVYSYKKTDLKTIDSRIHLLVHKLNSLDFNFREISNIKSSYSSLISLDILGSEVKRKMLSDYLTQSNDLKQKIESQYKCIDGKKRCNSDSWIKYLRLMFSFYKSYTKDFFVHDNKYTSRVALEKQYSNPDITNAYFTNFLEVSEFIKTKEYKDFIEMSLDEKIKEEDVDMVKKKINVKGLVINKEKYDAIKDINFIPIWLRVYKRVEPLNRCIKSLSKVKDIDKSMLVITVDGRVNIKEIIELISKIDFMFVRVYFHPYTSDITYFSNKEKVLMNRVNGHYVYGNYLMLVKMGFENVITLEDDIGLFESSYVHIKAIMESNYLRTNNIMSLSMFPGSYLYDCELPAINKNCINSKDTKLANGFCSENDQHMFMKSSYFIGWASTINMRTFYFIVDTINRGNVKTIYDMILCNISLNYDKMKWIGRNKTESMNEEINLISCSPGFEVFPNLGVHGNYAGNIFENRRNGILKTDHFYVINEKNKDQRMIKVKME